MPDEVKGYVLEALEEIKDDEVYKKICRAIYYCMKNEILVDHVIPGPEDGIKAEFSNFFPAWYMAEGFAKDMERRGVSKKIISDTLMVFSNNIQKNIRLSGIPGTRRSYDWIRYFAQGKIIQVNDFQYEIVNKDGKYMLGVHIPPKTRLNVLDNARSFKEALDFFEKFYPEYDMTGLRCISWLLSTEIEEVMGGPTNITRFGDMFERYDVGDVKGMAVFSFVFNKAKPYPPIEELPEETSMQRKMKEYMLSGKRILIKGGFISRERLDKIIKEAEA